MGRRRKNAEKPDTWWQSLLYGLLSFGLAGFAHWYFTDFEQSDRLTTVRMPWWMALTYGLFGKWPITVLLVLGGLTLIGSGIHKFVKKDAAPEESPDPKRRRRVAASDAEQSNES